MLDKGLLFNMGSSLLRVLARIDLWVPACAGWSICCPTTK